MNKIRDIKLTAGNLSLRAELFAYGDVTLAKLYSDDSSYFDGTNLDYGWAYRAPEDKPDRMKGMTVALGKAMDSCILTPKLRHDLLAQLKQPLIDPVKEAPKVRAKLNPDPNPWRMGTNNQELQAYGKNFHFGMASITGLQIMLPMGTIAPGGFGVGIRRFWVKDYWDSVNWFRPEQIVAWRYQDA